MSRQQALVVDDSRAVRTIVGNILRELGYDVHEAGDGRQALEVARTLDELHLALVDWNMPVMNGLEFVHALREDDAYRATRVVMVTTETDMDYVRRALAAGADEYVMKPFTKDVIIDKLAITGL